MKKRKNMNKIEEAPNQNPVAKFAHQFNKAQVFDDKTEYRRQAKHRKQEASPYTSFKVDGEASCQVVSLRPAKQGELLTQHR
ncbi:hypothetical protein MGMO_20c00090 [Methyloglobulus morosus KoM1]|uniref:Uncharacterized protein n=1 Tax=Methyloglobulus morosus KoM1 TaxID=1116472 RepID=V5C045_9GAMM|nr:hypothetical protein [Methyloglobulus morosus]ESS73454.1 hypothetical protein MGMO_20c00090 [Methyloglobulus morosus KoM1]